jgi:hypothetical protein
MGVIKTALEIALERSETVKSDKSSIEQFEAKQRGKKLANGYLAGEIGDLGAEIRKTPSAQQDSLKQGIFDVLVSQIALPLVSAKEDEKKKELLGSGLQAVINTKEFSALYKQLMAIFSRYLQEAAQYDQAIKAQYAPKLHQKEEELGRRLGREVRIDPLQDPEFVSFYTQNMNALKANYEGVVEQAREEARRMFENK